MLRHHGGRVVVGVVDYSSPSNPLGPPEIIEDIIVDYARSRGYSRYPDYEYRELRDAIANYYKLDPELIVPLNGSAEALQLLLPVIKPRTLISIEPTFGDHRLQAYTLGVTHLTIPYTRRGWRFELNPAYYCELPRALREEALILLSNPNNPTGTLTPRAVIEELLECSGANTVIVVDEAFADFTEGEESLLGVTLENTVILRSFTKILGIQGLRAGFLYTSSRRLVARIDNLRQPWNVNSLSSRIVVELLRWSKLKSYIEEARRVVEIERSYLTSRLKDLGLTVYESQAPFILLEQPIPHPKFNEELLKRGFYVRDASTFTYLTLYHSRVSVRMRDDNVKLVRAVEEVLAEVK